MESSNIGLIVGFIVLILSWVIPPLIKDRDTSRIVGMLLSILATGIFIGLLF